MIYLDSSLLVSIYSVDANSAAAADLLQQVEGSLLITTLCKLEAANALELRVFRKEITREHASAALQKFESNLRDGVYILRPITEAAFLRAHQLSRISTAKLGTRTADLLHIAAAIELGATKFYSFDQQQRKLAKTLDLKLNHLR